MSGKKASKTVVLSYDKMRKMSRDPSCHIHFVGVGGVSMYSLAMLTQAGGATVSGSDRERSRRTDALCDFGISVSIGHDSKNVDGVSLVVYSHAISADNPELVASVAMGIPTVTRAEFMGAMMLEYKNRIGISGSHGKSTTTAMLDCIMAHAGVSPTTLSGAELDRDDPLRIGSDSLMIYEACEYKDSFLRFRPTISVGLNLELDHTDYFENIDQLKRSFLKALGHATRLCLLSGDDPNLTDIRWNIKIKTLTFGASEGCYYRYKITAFRRGGFDFRLFRDGVHVGDFKLNIPGAFNIHNATAAISVALEYGIDPDTIAEAIESFRGVRRRLELVGEYHGRQVYYDYAHHPTEIFASIHALKILTSGPVTVIFRPHTYSRTRALWSELAASLGEADFLILTDIYGAREEPIQGITSERLASEIGSKAIYCPDDEVLRFLDIRATGCIVLMGAGDLEKIKNSIIK